MKRNQLYLPIATAAAAAAALACMALIRPGLLRESAVERASFVEEHRLLWIGAWSVVAIAMILLWRFLLWWAVRVPGRDSVGMRVLVTAGLALDLVGITLLLLHFERFEDLARSLTAGAATGAYSIVGLWLTSEPLGRSTSFLSRVVWTAGLALSIVTFVGIQPVQVAASSIMWVGLPVLALLAGRDLAYKVNNSSPHG